MFSHSFHVPRLYSFLGGRNEHEFERGFDFDFRGIGWRPAPHIFSHNNLRIEGQNLREALHFARQKWESPISYELEYWDRKYVSCSDLGTISYLLFVFQQRFHWITGHIDTWLFPLAGQEPGNLEPVGFFDPLNCVKEDEACCREKARWNQWEIFRILKW